MWGAVVVSQKRSAPMCRGDRAIPYKQPDDYMRKGLKASTQNEMAHFRSFRFRIPRNIAEAECAGKGLHDDKREGPCRDETAQKGQRQLPA